MTISAASALPALNEAQAQHAHAVAQYIGGEVRATGGWLSFERFMDLALYAPGLGYYSAGSRKLGAGGDFVTAPEMSDLFSRCVARACTPLLREQGTQILELGAGSGRMAEVILRELDAADCLPERYAILEVSADLAERQRMRMAALPGGLRERVTWHERLPERPIRGVILANEVADALPCRRFRRAGAGIEELGVALAADGALREAAAAPEEPLQRAWEALRTQLPAPLPPGYTSEICVRLTPWIASLAGSLQHGALLLFDYGLTRTHYYHPQRSTGTLRCHFRQRAHDDPYINIGVQDITAWVDFSAVAQAAADAALEVSAFCTQAAFLLGAGLESLVAAARDEPERARLAGEARRLVMPEEMGEAFKVMALTRALVAPLPAFALQDLRHLL